MRYTLRYTLRYSVNAYVANVYRDCNCVTEKFALLDL